MTVQELAVTRLYPLAKRDVAFLQVLPPEQDLEVAQSVHSLGSARRKQMAGRRVRQGGGSGGCSSATITQGRSLLGARSPAGLIGRRAQSSFSPDNCSG